MANIAKTYTLVNGQPADATQVNRDFDDIINGVGDVTTLRPTATIAGLGLDADLVTLALPANTTISAAGAELINDADATAQRATLGAVSSEDLRLSDARPASDVSAWAKAASKPSYTPAEVGAKKITTGSFVAPSIENVTVTHGLGTTPSFVLVLLGNEVKTVNTMTSTTFNVSGMNTGFSCIWIAFA